MKADNKQSLKTQCFLKLFLIERLQNNQIKMGLSSLFHFFFKQKQSNMVSSSTIMPLLRTNTRNVWHKKQKKQKKRLVRKCWNWKSMEISLFIFLSTKPPCGNTMVVCYLEFLQRGCVLLRDDNTQDWEEPAGPRPQELHSAGNARSKA